MAVKLSDLSVRALKPRATRYEVAVAGMRGLVLAVYPSGERAWVYRTRKDGTLFRQKLGTYPGITVAEASRRYGALRAERSQGVDLAAKRQEARAERLRRPSFGALADDYLRRHARPRKRTWRADELMLARDVLPAWSRLRAEAITRAMVAGLIDGIVDRGAPAQAGKTLALVRKVFNFGVERGAVNANPAARMPRPAPQTTRDRVLSDPELRAFWCHVDQGGLRPQVAAALRVQLLTGQRIGEVLGIEWGEVDLAGATWLIPGAKSKNRRDHLVPLSTAALAIIEAQPRVGRFVFPSSSAGGDSEQPIRNDVVAHELRDALRVPPGAGEGARPLAAAFAGLAAEPFRTHDLRRTVETRLASLGIGREVRDRVLNHKDPTVGAVHYNRHDYLTEKRAALEAWASLLDRITAGAAPDNVTALPTVRRRA